MSGDFDFFKPDLSSQEVRRWFGFELAVRLILGTEVPTRASQYRPTLENTWGLSDQFQAAVERQINFVELGSHTRPDSMQSLALEVLRFYAEGKETPPHLAHSFLDECLATLGEDRSPVTERWLADRGFKWVDTSFEGMAMILPEPRDEPRCRFLFDINQGGKHAHRLMIYSGSGCKDAYLLTTGPSVSTVLTLGRVLGIPTERES